MVEGWQDDEYLILFDEGEAAAISPRYELPWFLGGYQIIGLRGWDDLILQNNSGELFTIPTVPLDPKHLAPFRFTIFPDRIVTDERLKGKIKWYVKPVVFGGDPSAKENITWVTLDQHIELVKWWDQLFRTMKPT